MLNVVTKALLMWVACSHGRRGPVADHAQGVGPEFNPSLSSHRLANCMWQLKWAGWRLASASGLGGQW